MESLRVYARSGCVSGSTFTVSDTADTGSRPAGHVETVGQRFPSQSVGVGEVSVFDGHPPAGGVM
jgi:hypothetical protein